MARTLTIIIAFLAVIVFGFAPDAAAGGGTWMGTAQESYDPGDEVEAVGYEGAALPDEQGPFLARLSLATSPDLATPNVPRSWLDLGPVTIEPTGLGGYLGHRVSIRFTLPNEMEPGEYYFEVRNADGEWFGELIGGWFYVGMEPEHPPWRQWPYDEPLIAHLPGHAMIEPSWSGTAVSVADLKAGRYPVFAERYMLDPRILEQPGVVTTTTVVEPEPARFIIAVEPVPPTIPALPSRALPDTGSQSPDRLASVAPPSRTTDPAVPLGPSDVAVALATIALVGAISGLGALGWTRARRRRAEARVPNEEHVPTLR